MAVDVGDVADLVIGSVILAVGLAAAAAALSSRPRVNRTSASFAAACILYGLRLQAQSSLVEFVTRLPATFFQYLDAYVTYTILVPATIFVESLLGPGWHGLLRRTWQAAAILGAAAIITDAAARQPYTAIGLNPPLVLIAIVIWFGHVAARARHGRWPMEARALGIAGVLFGAIVLYETASGRGVFGNIEAEPVAMLVFVAALGWFVLVRIREQAFGYAALSRELELARGIQQSLLPRHMPDVPGLRIRAAYLPMNAVAGDFYDVLPLPGGRVLVLVADVSGHGVPAALVASMVKIAVAVEMERDDRPGDILTGINRALTGKFEHAYVTAWCVVLDPSRSALSYAAAGHPPAVLQRADGRLDRLDRGGIVLSLMLDAAYETSTVPFEPGDRLLVYTDGLTEAARPGTDEFFGDRELARVLGSAPADADVLQTILEAHRRWIGEGAPLSDDVSVVVIEQVNGDAGPGAGAERRARAWN